MASVHNEERNILRLRAWEQRVHETNQAKELNPERVPLFGQPYKTNKGDELSDRIQRMLGSYEDDDDNRYPFAIEPLPIPTFVAFSQSDLAQPNADTLTKPPFHNQKAPSSDSFSSQPLSPLPLHDHASTFSNASLSQSQAGQLSHSTHQQIKSENHSDEMSSQSLDAKPPQFLRSSDHGNTDSKESCRVLLQGSTERPSDCASAMDVSTFNLKQSPKDIALSHANKGNALPAPSYPSLLLSKPPSVPKPTAYVRPMDGQDQVFSESPELKPSPEPYVPLPELINKSHLCKTMILPQFLETRTDEARCVQDILREMTHSWPPLLTGIHTPKAEEPSKSPLPAKEVQNVSSIPGKKNYDSPPADPPQLVQQSSSSSFQAAHSREAEAASSSDSESSSRSESDSEGIAEAPHQPPVNNSVKTEPDAPAVSHGDWQLGNWIRSSQQSSSIESQSDAHVSSSPAHKQPPPNQSFKHSSVEVVDPTREKSKPLQKEFTDNLGKPRLCSEIPQDNYKQQSSPSADSHSCSSLRNLPCNTYSSKAAKTGCQNLPDVALAVKCEKVVVTREKDLCFTVRPKVKTKIAQSKKSKEHSDAKKDSKRTSKHAPLDKRKAKSEHEPQVKVVLCGHCGVRYPNSCSCPTQSPAPPDQTSPAPPVTIGCSKPKSVCKKGVKSPHKSTHKHSEKTGHVAKSSREPHRPPKSLVVKIDLTLLPRVPQTSSHHQQTPSTAKRPAVVIDIDKGASDADAAATTQKLTKTSKNNIPQDVEVGSKPVPRKKQRLENKSTLSTPASVEKKVRSHNLVADKNSNKSTEGRERKQAKKTPVPLQQPPTPKGPAKDSKVHKRSSGDSKETSKTVRSKDNSKPKRSSGKHTEPPHFEKSSLGVPSSSQPTREALTHRPLLRHEARQHPVKHYIKEAKKLKHKADAESDKLTKTLNYLEAAMYFVESGIAMEKDPQISKSSYTMFSETVELLKFVLKLKNTVDPSSPPSENDFLALCLKCQSLLQMAMFRHKQKTALKYSKTLTDHFSSSTPKTLDPSVRVTDTPSPMPNMPSPAITSSSSGPGSNHSTSSSVSGPDAAGSSSVAVPLAVEQVAFTYVNITMLFLSAQDLWEQAEELAQKGSGLLTELDTLMGPLSLTSSMSSMVRYTRQGVHWLRLDSQKVK